MDTEGIASVSIITFAKVDVLLDFYVFFFFYQDGRGTLVATKQRKEVSSIMCKQMKQNSELLCIS